MECRSAEEMRQEAGAFARRIAPHSGGATVVALSGVLGAGKTTFAQAVAKALGVEEGVTSPTFVIEKTYQLQGQKFSRLVHVDAYRLERAHELEMLDWREIVADPGNLVLIEWPERVPELIPQDALTIRFDIHGDGRTISIDGEEKS